jgi:1-acyl-sn-glycerol-3-phosphate acyltransferase
MATIRSVVFTVFMFVTVMLFCPLVILVRPFGARASYSVCLFWIRFNLWMCKLLCGLDFLVEGSENIPDVNGVILFKHSSAYETLVSWLLFPQQSWVLKRELMWAPFLGWALATIHPISINRNAGNSAVQQIISQGKQRLSEGLWVSIFPEGTRMAPGETRRYGISGAVLAQEAGRLLIPVAHNAGDFWPRRGWRKRPGTVRFCIGPPVDPAGREPREVNTEIQDWVENKVAELRAQDSIDVDN